MAALPPVPSALNARRSGRPAKLKLSSPTEVLAAVPYLIGFAPERSVVVLCMRGKQLGLTMRVDLDMPAYELREILLARVRSDGADTALVVIFDPDAAAGSARPGGRLARSLIRTFRQAGIHVQDALGVREGRFWSYLCRDGSCCPPEGRTVPAAGEDDHSRVAATFVAIGAAPLASRDELDATLAGVSGPRATEVRACLDDALRAPPAHPVERWSNLVERYSNGPPRPGHALPLAEAARLIVSLRDVAVRDEIISWTAGEALEGVLTLLRELAPLALPPFDTQLLATLAWAAYSAGDGALASMALERALNAHPHHSLAQLLWTALEAGIDPAKLREVSHQAFGATPGGR